MTSKERYDALCAAWCPHDTGKLRHHCAACVTAALDEAAADGLADAGRRVKDSVQFFSSRDLRHQFGRRLVEDFARAEEKLRARPAVGGVRVYVPPKNVGSG